MRNILLFSLLIMPLTAHAYIGPGMGAGALAVIFGIMGAIFLGLFAKNRKNQVADSKDESDSA